MGFGFSPCGKFFGHRVHLPYKAPSIRGYDRIANAVQGGAKSFLGLTLLAFRVVEIAEKPGLLVPVTVGRRRRSEQDERTDHETDQARPVARFGQDFIRIHLGHQKPGRIRNRAQIRQHFDIPIVLALKLALFAKRRLSYRKVSLAHWNAKSQGGLGTMPECVQINDRFAIPLDQHCLGAGAGCGPGLDQRKQIGVGLAAQNHHGQGLSLSVPNRRGSIYMNHSIRLAKKVGQQGFLTGQGGRDDPLGSRIHWSESIFGTERHGAASGEQQNVDILVPHPIELQLFQQIGSIARGTGIVKKVSGSSAQHGTLGKPFRIGQSLFSPLLNLPGFQFADGGDCFTLFTTDVFGLFSVISIARRQ